MSLVLFMGWEKPINVIVLATTLEVLYAMLVDSTI